MHSTMTPKPRAGSISGAQFALATLAVFDLRQSAARNDVPYSVRLLTARAADLLAALAGVNLPEVPQTQQQQQSQEVDPAAAVWAESLDDWIGSPDGRRWLESEQARYDAGGWAGISSI